MNRHMALLLLLVVLLTNVLFQISWQFRLYSALVVLWYLYYYFLHSFKSREATARLDSDTSNRLMIVAIIWVPFLLFLWLTAIGGWISMLRYGVHVVDAFSLLCLTCFISAVSIIKWRRFSLLLHQSKISLSLTPQTISAWGIGVVLAVALTYGWVRIQSRRSVMSMVTMPGETPQSLHLGR